MGDLSPIFSGLSFSLMGMLARRGDVGIENDALLPN